MRAVLIRDVTRWRAADAARRASDDLLRTVTDNVPGAVLQFRVGPDGERSSTFVSRGVEALLERPAADTRAAWAAGKLLVLPEDRPAFEAALEHSRQTLSGLDVEYRVRTPRTGRLKWIRLRAMPTREPDGGTVWNGLMKDATDQVAALAALRRAKPDTGS